MQMIMEPLDVNSDSNNTSNTHMNIINFDIQSSTSNIASSSILNDAVSEPYLSLNVTINNDEHTLPNQVNSPNNLKVIPFSDDTDDYRHFVPGTPVNMFRMDQGKLDRISSISLDQNSPMSVIKIDDSNFERVSSIMKEGNDSVSLLRISSDTASNDNEGFGSGWAIAVDPNSDFFRRMSVANPNLLEAHLTAKFVPQTLEETSHSFWHSLFVASASQLDVREKVEEDIPLSMHIFKSLALVSQIILCAAIDNIVATGVFFLLYYVLFRFEPLSIYDRSIGYQYGGVILTIITRILCQIAVIWVPLSALFQEKMPMKLQKILFIAILTFYPVFYFGGFLVGIFELRWFNTISSASFLFLWSFACWKLRHLLKDKESKYGIKAFFVLLSPNLLGGFLYYIFAYVIFPWFADLGSDTTSKSVFVTFVLPIFTVFVLIAARIAGYTFSQSHPGVTWIMLVALMLVSSSFTRVIISDLGDFNAVFMVSMVYGIIELVSRLTISYRDMLVYMVFRQKGCSLNGAKQVMSSYYSNPRKTRLLADSIITEMWAEHAGIMWASIRNGASILACGSVPASEVAIRIFTNLFMQLGIEFFFDTISCFVEHKIGINLYESWMEKSIPTNRRRRVFFFAVWFLMAIFGSLYIEWFLWDLFLARCDNV